MRNLLSVLALGGMLAVAACGPSEAEKKATEQKRLDSIAAVEKTKLDSIANVAAAAEAKAAEAEAAVQAAKAELKGAKADAKGAKADAAKATKEKEEADKKAAEEAKKKEETKTGGKLLNKTGGTQNGQEVPAEQKGGKLKNKMN